MYQVVLMSSNGRTVRTKVLVERPAAEARRIFRHANAALLDDAKVLGRKHHAGEPYTSVDLYDDAGNRIEKGDVHPFSMSYLNGRVVGAYGPVRERGARKGKPAASPRGRGGANVSTRNRGRVVREPPGEAPRGKPFEVFIEFAKGSAKRIGKALYFATEAAAIERAKALLAQIEKDVGVHGEHRNGTKLRVDVVHAPSRQLVAETHWVKT